MEVVFECRERNTIANHFQCCKEFDKQANQHFPRTVTILCSKWIVVSKFIQHLCYHSSLQLERSLKLTVIKSRHMIKPITKHACSPMDPTSFILLSFLSLRGCRTSAPLVVGMNIPKSILTSHRMRDPLNYNRGMGINIALPCEISAEPM